MGGYPWGVFLANFNAFVLIFSPKEAISRLGETLTGMAVTISVGVMTVTVSVEAVVSPLVMVLAEAGAAMAKTGMMAMNGAEIGA